MPWVTRMQLFSVRSFNATQAFHPVCIAKSLARKPRSLWRRSAASSARYQEIAIAHDHSRANQQKESAGDKQARSQARVTPFMQRNAPQGGEDDDAGHMQRPA